MHFPLVPHATGGSGVPQSVLGWRRDREEGLGDAGESMAGEREDFLVGCLFRCGVGYAKTEMPASSWLGLCLLKWMQWTKKKNNFNIKACILIQVARPPLVGITLASLQARTTLTTTRTARTVAGASPYQEGSLSDWSFPTSARNGVTSCSFTTAPPPQVPCWWLSLANCGDRAEYSQQGHRFGLISAQIQAFREEDLRLTS